MRWIFAGFSACVSIGSAAAQDLIPVEHFARLPQVEDLELSPNGSRYAGIIAADGRQYMAALPTDGESAPVVVDYGDYRPLWLRWANDQYVIMSISFPSRRGFQAIETLETRMAVADMETGDVDNLIKFRQPAKGRAQHFSQFQDNLISTLPNDPKNVLVGLDRDEPGQPGVYRVPASGGTGSRVIRDRGGIDRWHADASGVVRLGWGFREKSSGYQTTIIRMVYRESEDEDFRTISEYDTKDAEGYGFGFLGFTENPDEILITDVNEWGRRALFRYDVTKGATVETIFSNSDYDLGGISMVPNTDRLAAIYYYADKLEIEFVDEESRELHESLLRAFPGQDGRIISQTRDGGKLIAVTGTPTEPPLYHYFDLDAQVHRILGGSYPELEGMALTEIRPIAYEARDGLEISGYLTVPAGADPQNLPLIVHPHGGPSARDTMTYNYWVQFFASRGWAVLQMNFRGSDGFGKRFERSGWNEWGRAMQDDITDGVEWAIREGIADPDRICIVGGSYGGYATLQGLVKTPDLYQCGVALNGVYDIGELIADARFYAGFLRWRDYWRQENADEISPARNADKIKAPVLIAYGDDDRIVDHDQSTAMISALRRADKEVVKLRLKDGDHGLSKAQNRIAFFAAMDKFLQEHIGLGPVPVQPAVAEAQPE